MDFPRDFYWMEQGNIKRIETMKGKNKSHGKVVGIALLFAITMMLSSVAAAGDGTRQDDELILRIAMQDDLKTTNPLTAGDVWTWNVIGYLYDGPINVNPETEELIPYIAVGSANTSTSIDYTDGELGWDDCDFSNFAYTPRETWGPNSDIGETIVFYDFEDVFWHDGQQMDIRDVLFSMHVTAQIPEWSSSMNCLKDAGGKPGASNFSETSFLHIYKVWESEDKKQAAVKYVLQEPFADFFRNTLSTFLLPEHIWAYKISGQEVDGTRIWSDSDYSLDSDTAWSVAAAQEYENEVPVGNGPFKWDHWEKGQLSKIVTWRDHFYTEGYKYEEYVLDTEGNSLAGQPNIDAMIYKIYKTAEAAVLALKNDDIDYIAWSVPPTFVQELANEPGVALQQSPEQGFFYLSYNMRRESFGYDGDKQFPYAPEDDIGKPFRKAVAHCIDKNRVVQRLLLNFGIGGEGPVSSISSWFNDTIPRYSFDPDEAKNILSDAGYKLTDGSVGANGLADVTKAVDGNWWLNPDGSQIGSESGGLIKILTPEANYDPIRAQAGLMIAQQMVDIGINTKSEAMDFGSIVDRIDKRDFDMYILGWRIGSDPTDFLHAFFHSSTAQAGQNYPGYQNESFDEIIDEARKTGDEDIRKKAVMDSQAAIVYDLPYDVLYFRTNIEAYRSDRFTGWQVGSSGSIYNWASIMNLRAPSPYKTNAQFVSPPSAVESNSTGTPITVYVKDQDGKPLVGAYVILNASMGKLGSEHLNTTTGGKVTTTFTAPYVDPSDPDAAENGSKVIIQIKSASYFEGETVYDPAPSRLTLITVYPEGQSFLSVSMEANPDIIDPDVSADGETFGFTYIEVTVEDENGDPVSGATVAVTVSPAIPEISPGETTTNADGMASFTLTATNEPDDDNSVVEYQITAYADTGDPDVKPGDNTINVEIVEREHADDPNTNTGTPFPTFILVASVFCVAAVSYGALRRKK